MGYLEQFAQNRRRKENTTVLTARLQESVYDDFKTYCDELGLYSLSISEAVCLIVKHNRDRRQYRNSCKHTTSRSEYR